MGLPLVQYVGVLGYLCLKDKVRKPGVGQGRNYPLAGWSSPKAELLTHTAELRLCCLSSRFRSLETVKEFPPILPRFRECLVSMGPLYRLMRMF